ncbi:hypothetical protein JCM18750_00670 [Halostagnicola bangensis]
MGNQIRSTQVRFDGVTRNPTAVVFGCGLDAVFGEIPTSNGDLREIATDPPLKAV